MAQKDRIREFEDLYRLWYRPLCLYALHYLDDIGKAEDIVQECYISLWEKKDTVLNHRSYLYTSFRNRCIDMIRSGKSKDRREDLEGELASIPDSDGSDGLAGDAEAEAQIWTAIDSLPEKCRNIFLMAKRDGMKYGEIAEELDISENTVRNQVSKALRILQEGTRKIIFFLLNL